MQNSQPQLSVKDLHAGYGDLTVLRGVNVTVSKGRTTAVLGPNGAGKTTLMRTIAAALPRAAGEIWLDGVSQSTEPNHRWMRRIGWVPEGRMLFADYSVRDNLYQSACAAGTQGEFEVALAECVKLFPIVGERLRTLAGTLSGGQQQMVAIARAIVRRPCLLLLDEPSLGLAPKVLNTIRDAIRQLQSSGLSVLIAEQNVPWLEGLVDDVVVMSQGRDVLRGTADLLHDREAVKRIYIGSQSPGGYQAKVEGGMKMIDVETLHGRIANNRWDRVCVGDIIERVTWSTPHKTAFVASADAVKDPRFASLTFAEANTLVNRIAQALLSEGLERSARVALYCDNSVEAYITKLAIAKAGLVAVPINVMMSLDVVEEMLRHVGATVAIVDQFHLQRVRSSIERAGARLVAVIGDLGEGEGRLPTFAEYAAGASSDEPDVTIAGDDIWEILLTSGTTSQPKAVMISHTYSYFAALSYALTYTRGLNSEHDLKIATFLPVVYHIGDHAFVLSALLCGGSVVLGRVPDPYAMAAAISEHSATGLWAGSPQLLKGVVEAAEQHPELNLKSLTVALYGWGSIPPPLFKRLRQVAGEDVRLVGLFGQTEAIACHRFRPDLWPELYERTAPDINYVGMPTPLLASTVVDPEGNSLLDLPGIVGEAVYRSPVMMAGYYRDEEATRAAFRDGWFHSQDACEIGERGLRIMVDRYKDMVKSGGENVSTIRVEAVLHDHPAVTQAAVVGVPDARWGEAVTAAVVLKRPGAVTPEDLIAFCRERLAAFETPKRVVVVDTLPTTVGGKVQKHKLRQLLKP